MKILHVLKHSFRGNGHVHVAVDLACAQADAGHDVVFAHAQGSYDGLLTDHGVRLALVTEPTERRYAVRSLIDLVGHARRLGPDVIHAHMMSSAVLSLPTALVTRSALVTTVHNSFESHSSLMRLGTLAVAVSHGEHERLLEEGFSARRTVTVLNGAVGSPREQLPKDDIGSLDQPSIMTLSGLHGRKAVDDVIRAFSQVLPDFPTWHLNIVGGGPDLEKLQALVNRLELERSVRFLGSTLTPGYLLENASIFASASLAEPFGLTVAEARAAGCAIVATCVGGIPEVLEHGRAGILVEPSSPGQLADAFRTLMGDPAALREWQSRALRGNAAFAVARMARDYDDIYRRAIEMARRGRSLRRRPE